MAKSDTADSIFGQKSGPALAGPAGPAATALNKRYFECFIRSKAEDIYTAAGWESIYQNRYIHGGRSGGSAKSAIYTAAGCQLKIAIYTAAVP